VSLCILYARRPVHAAAVPMLLNFRLFGFLCRGDASKQDSGLLQSRKGLALGSGLGSDRSYKTAQVHSF
jgi:hypothetical protein